jgi:hypothetical protein
MINFEYVNFPSIPKELYKEIHKSILDNPDEFQTPGPVNRYTIHNGTAPLYEFVSTFLDSSYLVQPQKIFGGYVTPIHIDTRRNFTYNYLIDCGGDEVYTNFYDKDLNLIEQHCIEPFRWHRLNVECLHNVTGTTPGRTRVALTVFQPVETKKFQAY